MKFMLMGFAVLTLLFFGVPSSQYWMDRLELEKKCADNQSEIFRKVKAPDTVRFKGASLAGAVAAYMRTREPIVQVYLAQGAKMELIEVKYIGDHECAAGTTNEVEYRTRYGKCYSFSNVSIPSPVVIEYEFSSSKMSWMSKHGIIEATLYYKNKPVEKKVYQSITPGIFGGTGKAFDTVSCGEPTPEFTIWIDEFVRSIR